jgi:hypothetical protein
MEQIMPECTGRKCDEEKPKWLIDNERINDGVKLRN